MSEFEKWWESGSSPRQGKASARDGWNARDPEVAELKRQLSEARNAALVESWAAIAPSKRLRQGKEKG